MFWKSSDYFEMFGVRGWTSISKDFNEISNHPDDAEEEGDGNAASSSCDSLSELSAGTVPYKVPQVQGLKDQKLQRLVDQMRMGIKGHEFSTEKGGVAPEKDSTPEQPAQISDGAESVPQKKDEKKLQEMGEQLKALVEKATRHAQSKQGIPYIKQELPGHVSWI